MVYTIGGEQLTRRKLVIIDGSMVTSETGMPLMLNINLPGVKTDGADVRLATTDGTPIAREIECTDVPNTDDVTIHYPFDTAASTDSQFYVYWGNAALTEPAANSTYGSQNVWDNNYVYVNHMNDITTSINSVDGTAATVYGAPYVVDTDYGKAVYMDGSDDYIDIGNIAYLSSGFTISYSASKRSTNDKTSWYKGTSTREYMELNGYVDEFGSYIYDQEADFLQTMALGSQSWVSGQYYLRTSIWDGGTTDAALEQYLDNSIISHTHNGSGTFGMLASSNGNFLIGTDKYIWNRYFDGNFAEFRISKIVRSDNYRTTEYKNLNNPTASGTSPFYLSFGNVQHQHRVPAFIN